jgi:hypothetical protein
LGGKKGGTLVASEKNREGKGREGNAVHTNAPRPIFIKRELASKATRDKDSHKEKQPSPSSSTDAGSTTAINPDPRKACFSTLCSLEGDSNVTDIRLLQQEKHSAPNTFTEAGITILLNPDPPKADFSTTSRSEPEEKTTDTSLLE